MTDSMDISTKKRLEYIDHIEALVDNFFDSLEKNSQKPTKENNQQKLIDNFIASANPETIQEDNQQADVEIQKIWQDLRQKMLKNSEKQISQEVTKTTKRYVRKFLKDIQPKESSKIKLSKEEEEKLKLFSKLK